MSSGDEEPSEHGSDGEEEEESEDEEQMKEEPSSEDEDQVGDGQSKTVRFSLRCRGFDDSSSSESSDEDSDDESSYGNGANTYVPLKFDEPTFRLDQSRAKRPKWTTSQARLSIIDELKDDSSPVHQKEEDNWQSYFYQVSAVYCLPNIFLLLIISCRNMQLNGLNDSLLGTGKQSISITKTRGTNFKSQKTKLMGRKKTRSHGQLKRQEAKGGFFYIAFEWMTLHPT